MAWSHEPIANGVVITRRPQDLEPGEVQAAPTCALRDGDPVSVYRDKGRGLHAEFSVDIIEVFYLSFEDATDQIFVVTAEDFYIADADGGAFATVTVTGTTGYTNPTGITKAVCVHEGNRYFIGTDWYNVVVESDGTVRNMGMFGTRGFDRWSDHLTITALGVTAQTGGTYDAFIDGEYVIYVMTHYDSVRDLESIMQYGATVSNSGANFYAQITQPATETTINPNKDSYRLYRKYLGDVNGSIDDDFGTLSFGFVTELTINPGGTYNDDPPTTTDPATPYPSISVDGDIGSPVVEALSWPNSFDVGVIYQGHFLVNSPSESGQIVRISVGGNFEYFPDSNYVPFVTKDGDTIVGMAKVPRVDEDIAIILTHGGTHRLRWIPTEENSPYQTGRAQSEISDDGCVGRHAYCTVNDERHRLVVWLSHQGLRATDGLNWTDACRDWSVATSGLDPSRLSDCVMYNDERFNRIVLHGRTSSSSETWHFYYHPTHSKRGGFKAMGPHVNNEFNDDDDYVVSATTNRFGGYSSAWVATKRKIYREHFEKSEQDVWVGKVSTEEMSLTTRRNYFDNRQNDVQLLQVGLDHNGTDHDTIEVTGYAATPESTEQSEVRTLNDCKHNGATKQQFGNLQGKSVWVKFRSLTYDDHIWGPAALDTSHSKGDSS